MLSVNLPSTASPENANLTLNIQNNRRYSVPDHHYRSSSRAANRASHRDHHYSTYYRESIGERIKRFFGIGSHKVRVDSLGRPIYAT